MRPWIACNGFAVQATAPRHRDAPPLHGERTHGGEERRADAAPRDAEDGCRAGAAPGEET